MTETSTSGKLTPPPGFEYDPDVMNDYEDQVQHAIAEAAHQAEPVPSFEGVPTVAITPTFNPTNAPDSEILHRIDHLGRSGVWRHVLNGWTTASQ